MKQNIKKDYIWNSIGVFAQNAMSPLLLLIVTRVNGIEDSGVFSFAFAISVIAWAIAMWGGRTYQVSDAKNTFSHAAYLTSRYMLAIVSILAAVIFIVLNDYDPDKSYIIVALVLFRAIESISDSIYGVMQKYNKLYISGISLVIKSVLGLGAFFVVNLMTNSMLWSIIAVIFVNITVLLFFDILRVKEHVLLTSPFRHMRKNIHDSLLIIRASWPVFAVLVISMLSLNIPRYFLDIYHQDQIGYYGIISMPVTLIVLLMSFILQPRVVGLSRLFLEKNIQKMSLWVRGVAMLTLGAGVITVTATYFFGAPLLSWIFGVDFMMHQTSLILIVLGAVANALVGIYVNTLIIMRKFSAQLYILLVSNVIIALVSGPIIEHYGMLGAVALFTATGAAQVVLLGIYVQFLIRKGL